MSDPLKLYELLMCDEKIVNYVNFINDDIARVDYSYLESYECVNAKTNVVLACMTTSWARLHLYQYMEKVGNKIIYCDTDSIIYRYEQDPIEKTPYLGGMTDELVCADDGCADQHYITQFVSTGPKCYSYATDDGTKVMKIKGITLNYKNNQLLDFDTMKNMVIDESKVVEFTNPHKIVRDKKTCTLLDKSQKKQFRLVFTKRARRGVLTQPYGY